MYLNGFIEPNAGKANDDDFSCRYYVFPPPTIMPVSRIQQTQPKTKFVCVQSVTEFIQQQKGTQRQTNSILQKREWGEQIICELRLLLRILFYHTRPDLPTARRVLPTQSCSEDVENRCNSLVNPVLNNIHRQCYGIETTQMETSPKSDT